MQLASDINPDLPVSVNVIAVANPIPTKRIQSPVFPLRVVCEVSRVRVTIATAKPKTDGKCKKASPTPMFDAPADATVGKNIKNPIAIKFNLKMYFLLASSANRAPRKAIAEAKIIRRNF